MAALAAVLSPRPAAAETFQCKTRTERADHVVSLGGVAGVPPLALSLRSGEVLCVTGRPNGDGVLEDLRVLESSRGVATPVIELRLLRNGKTLLEVRHSSTQHLQYRPFGVWQHLDVALEENLRKIAPKGVSTEQWDAQVQRLLLADFRFYDEPPEPRPETEPVARGPEDRSAWFGLDFWVGERYAALAPLSAAIARDGFVPISNTSFWFGGSLDGTLGRVRFGFSAGGSKLSTPSVASNATLTTTLFELGAHVGYDVFRYDYLSVHVTSGLTAGDLSLDPRTPGLSLFDGQYDPETPGDARWEYVTLPIEIGFDYTIPFSYSRGSAWALRFGTRVGWMQQLSGGWGVPGGGPVDAPALDVSGVRGALVLSLGATEVP